MNIFWSRPRGGFFIAQNFGAATEFIVAKIPPAEVGAATEFYCGENPTSRKLARLLSFIVAKIQPAENLWRLLNLLWRKSYRQKICGGYRIYCGENPTGREFVAATEFYCGENLTGRKFVAATEFYRNKKSAGQEIQPTEKLIWR